jgi:hypothetical protein
VFIGAEFGDAVTLTAEEVPPARRWRFLSLLLVTAVGALPLARVPGAAGSLHVPDRLAG